MRPYASVGGKYVPPKNGFKFGVRKTESGQPPEPIVACTKVMYKQFNQVSLTTPLATLARKFDKDHFALVVTEQRCYSGGHHTTTTFIAGVVTRIDLLNFITANP